MKINKIAKAGTLESNDILIMVAPKDGDDIDVELESIVMEQFGEDIEKTIKEKLIDLGVSGIKVKAQDKGALDYTIKARVETAVQRAAL